MHEFAFGEAAGETAIGQRDLAFLASQKSFARGEVHLAGEAPAVAAYRHVRARRFTEAIAVYDTLLAVTPQRQELWVNRGVALQATGKLEPALASFDRALLIDPDYVAGHINKGVVLGWLSRNTEALVYYNRALAREPDNEAARLGRSVILSSVGRFDEALADAEHVLERNPGSGGAHYNRALILLSLGDYAEGFREHEWRFGTDSILGRYQFTCPRWLGQRTDKTILVHCEQGLGDHIQFARYLPLLRARGLDVRLEAPPSLLRLFAQLDVPVATYEERSFAFAYHCPIISLAAVLATTLESVPLAHGYLQADPRDAAHWATKLAHLPYPRVGVCWSSGVRPDQVIAVAMQRRKSIPTGEFSRLLDLPGIAFVSLQKDTPAGGIPVRLFDPMPDVRDLADTAAIIANLDLVVTVDSAVAHLAGAMGKPVWVLNRHDICWRWLSGDKQSPWYASAKIYRQSQPLEWKDVMSQISCDLRKVSNV